MEPLTFGKIVLFVGKIIVGERIKQFTNPLFSKHKDDFICRLSKIIHSSIDDYEKKYGEIIDAGTKIDENHITIIPFYKSERFIGLLLKYKYYENHNVNAESIFEELKEDKRIITANVEQISNFLTIFNDKISKDEELKILEIEIGYKQKIYDIYEKLDKIIELLSSENKIDIDGNGNLIFQKIKDSPITINVENITELKNALIGIKSTEKNTEIIIELINSIEEKQNENYNLILSELKQIFSYIVEIYKKGINNILNIIILSTTSEKLNNGHNEKDNYGNHSKEWKPFKNENNIDDLLNFYGSDAGFIINKLYFEDFELFSTQDRKKILADILGEKNNFIIIIDTNILLFEEFNQITDLFNNEAIGGCIIPIYEPIICNEISGKVEYKLKYLYTHFFEHLHKDFIQIELFVPTKEMLFRRLSNIAINKLKREPNKKSKFKKNIESEIGKIIPKL